MIDLINQIKIATTRLKTAHVENNPTEQEVWRAILRSLTRLNYIKEITKEG